VFVHLPLLIPPLWIVYQQYMSTELNIRIDLFVYPILFMVISLIYLLRLIEPVKLGLVC